jgi:multiple antibiotic resistance protein
MHVPSSLLSSFVTLFVTIGPIAVIFAGLTSRTHHKQRRSLALRSVAIAGLMLLLFAVGGNLARLAPGISRGGWHVVVPAGADADIF